MYWHPVKADQWQPLHCLLLLLSSLMLSVDIVRADCHDHTPAFPLPKLDRESKILQQAWQEIESTLKSAVSLPGREATSFSVALTSSTETLFEFHHTAEARDPFRPGAQVVDGTTCYRIASCTKAFTVLALLQQQKAGKVSLDDPVNKYIAELNEPQTGTLPWKDITLRTLASQLSGIPRDIAQSDEVTELPDPVSHGLPPLSPSDHHEARCDSITNYTHPCTPSDLIDYLKQLQPIYPPKQTSTYSNLNYELLALVLSNVTSVPYETLIQTSILDPLNLTSTSFDRPPDAVAALLPNNLTFYWDIAMGMQNPTGGLYSSTDDLGKFIRYLLTHYNGLTPALNWINPVSYGTGMNTFYGTPWEIYRTSSILSYTRRPVTFVTKGGSLPAYASYIVSVPDYDFGFAILVASATPLGQPNLASLALDAIGTTFVRAADQVAQQKLAKKYTGTWSADSDNLNSSLTLSHSLSHGGLYVSRWISNGTDILNTQLGSIPFPYIVSRSVLIDRNETQYLQAVPTLLFKDEKNQRGEVWRLIARQKMMVTEDDAHRHQRRQQQDGRHDYHSSFGETGVFAKEFCITDIDIGSYGGLPLNELVFWNDDEDDDEPPQSKTARREERQQRDDEKKFTAVDLTGFRVRLRRVNADVDGGVDRHRKVNPTPPAAAVAVQE